MEFVNVLWRWDEFCLVGLFENNSIGVIWFQPSRGWLIFHLNSPDHFVCFIIRIFISLVKSIVFKALFLLKIVFNAHKDR